MLTVYTTILAGLLLNFLSLVPVLAIPKTEKKIKLQIASRLYLLSVFLIISMLALTQNITLKASIFPLWFLFAAVIMFIIMLKTTAKLLRKYLSKGQSRAVILSSFVIIFAVRVSAVFSGRNTGYTISNTSIVWTFRFFLHVCWLILLVQIKVLTLCQLLRKVIIPATLKAILLKQRLITISGLKVKMF